MTWRSSLAWVPWRARAAIAATTESAAGGTTWNVEVVEVRDLDDQLTLATIRLIGHGAGSAAPTDQATWQVGRWRRGKCVWWRAFQTRTEALEAVGLSE
jgi:hypothetical protein